jgi:S1-C subfamily serine protease
MVVPIDLLPPILADLETRGRADRPPRPWLGLYATETEDGVVVMGAADKGPAEAADLRAGDVLAEVAGEPVADLAGFFRQVWALGEAGVRVPLTVSRDGRLTRLSLTSVDRDRFLIGPRLH